MGRFGWLMTLGCLALACSSGSRSSLEHDAGSAVGALPPVVITDAADYEIYNLALASLHLVKGPLVVAREAEVPAAQSVRRRFPGDAEAEEHFLGPFKALGPSLISAVLSVPEGRLDSRFSSAYAVEILDKSQREAALACPTDGGSPVNPGACFDESHKRPLIHFSRIAFNQARDKAVVDVGMECGNVCGRGATLVVAFEKGRWVVSKELFGWIR